MNFLVLVMVSKELNFMHLLYMIDRDSLYNHYLIMLEDCINFLTVKSEHPKSFWGVEVEIHNLCFPSPIDVERIKDLVCGNLLEKNC